MLGTWDRDRLDQVLSNLLSNAIKYSPSGGEILLRVEVLGAIVQVSVRDQGAGIAADQLPRLFDRFYRGPQAQATAPGLGLGLSITKALVAAHGGRIWTESPGPGQGATFRFTLPYQPPGEIPERTR